MVRGSYMSMWIIESCLFVASYALGRVWWLMGWVGLCVYKYFLDRWLWFKMGRVKQG